ncbi:MAG: HD domain-containing phosphohydrolase [Methylococcales bacterium]
MDKLIFKKEDDFVSSNDIVVPWKILIVDDEDGIHQVTTLALKQFVFDERPLVFFHAYSAQQATEILNIHKDIALVLLDVVMESNHAGLKLIKVIRNDLKNSSIRIILRTGQPGQAPERQIIRDYDINDYKTKTELTSNKLFTLMYAALRAYRDIITLQKSKKGLKKLISASRGISSSRVLTEFIRVTLEQLVVLLNIDETALFSCETGAFELIDKYLDIYLVNGHQERIKLEDLSPDKKNIVLSTIDRQANVFENDKFVMYCANPNHIVLFYAHMNQSLSDLDINILSIFTENMIVTLENIYLNELISESQKEMVYRLGEVVESRSKETGNHVKRVAYYSECLALLVGLPRNEAELLKTASPMHDIGKIAIPDAILTKPGKLDPEEWEIMKTHTTRGAEILEGSELMVIKLSRIVALTHHEKWDGTGYPCGLKGDDIHIYGRITAIADVFDALGSDRCYKKAWPLDQIVSYFKEHKGKQFDPRLIDLLLENLDDFLAIGERFKDKGLN